jgi:hypothetical protein
VQGPVRSALRLLQQPHQPGPFGRAAGDILRGQGFGRVRNAFIRIVNQADGAEIARYDLSEDASAETAMVFGELYRHGVKGAPPARAKPRVGAEVPSGRAHV